MAEAKPPSTSDLLLLIPGFQIVKTPDLSAHSGEDYYLNPPIRSDERTLRETAANQLYLNSPQAAWNNVRFRDWLIATFFGNIADKKHDFTAISEPVLYSMDLLGKKFDRYSEGMSEAIKQALLSSALKLERTFFSTLTFGISRQKVGSKEVFLFGAGMRRRAQLWLNQDEALQVDAEFFVPFLILPNHEHGAEVSSSSVRSICAGITLRNTRENMLRPDKDDKIVAMRFNLRIPFKAELLQEGDKELQTQFGKPEIKFQKKIKDGLDWEEFKDWEPFLEEYCARQQVGELLNSPMGPLLAEKISDGSGVTDLILKQSKRDEIKANLPQFKEDVKDTFYLLKHVWEWQPPDPKDPEPNSGSRKLGSLLKSLGFMSGKPPSGGDIEYSFKLAPKVTVWSVLNRIIDELDGFPLYLSGLDSKKDKYNRIAVSLASQANPTDETRKYFGVAGLAYNVLLNPVSKKESTEKGESEKPSIVLSKDNFTTDESILIDPDEDEEVEQEGTPEPEIKDPTPPSQKEQSKVDVLLQLGKWFSGETLDDNWMLRLLPKPQTPGQHRTPLPGIRVLPFKKVTSSDNTQANFSWTFLFELLSVGIDIQGTTKDGLTFLEGLAGYFGLGAVELRLTFMLSLEDINKKKNFFDRVAIGIGVKLKDMRLSLGPKEEDDKKKEKGKGDEIIEGLQELLADDWAVLPATKPTKRTVKTRLSAKKKDKFSISFGYLSPLKDGGNSTLDIQLYDEKGNRGKMALIPIDRFAEPIYLKQIGIALKGVENVEIRKGLPDSAQLTVMLTGGIRLPVFELGFIGAKLTFQLNSPGKMTFTLDGLDVSVKFGSVIISGSFMKIGIEYAGSLTVNIPKGSFSAMGFYGSLLLFDFASETDTVYKLNTGQVPKKLDVKLHEKDITPKALGRAPGGGWELHSSDNKQYMIEEYEGKFIVLRPDKTFFIYVTLSAASGTGIPLGPIQITGLVFGYGYNRRAKIPTIENVAEFPLVKMVMGQGGYQKEDETFELHNQLAKPVEDPVSVLEKMKDHLVPELGQQFACGGVRFTIAGTIDCFALIVVQWGDDKIEISLLGLARFRQPRDTTARAICYVELQILMTIKPSEGTFKLQALLSNNSWIINQDCKLTGGFALFAWFDGDHKGDLVITLGGYHPRFRRPDHYPIVPRLGLNWPVNDNLSIKGGLYLAYTPSCGMLGAKLEATFHSGRISAWFTAYLDVIINWSPIFFEAELGISLRVQARFFLTSLDVTVAASIKMWGPPVGGIAHVNLTVVKFDIPFGQPRPEKLELIETWQQFCHSFLNLEGGDRRPVIEPVPAFPVVQPNLAAGRNNINNLPNALRRESKPKPEERIWRVRADELELAATTAVPVTTMNIGKIKTSHPAEGVQQLSMSGRSMMVTRAMTLESQGLRTKNSANKIGVHPMGREIQSVLNVTIVRDEVSSVEVVEVPDWTIEEEFGSLPAALWEPGQPNMRPSEPSAKLVHGCITGIKRLKPKRGALGKKATPPPIDWNPLGAGNVPKPTTIQEKPGTGGVREVQQLLAQKQADQEKIVAALAATGFSLTWKPVPQAEVRFRELNADPLTGAVAA
ncbi:MAG TPA: DUF6603 domain-containing protein [Pyrinomonadaceae bacterium]|nr:DUF6603 domain-containing protein [Pyrinomonadaceae bacterium]